MRKSVTQALKLVLLLTGAFAMVALAQSSVELQTANAMARATKKVPPSFPPAAKQLNVSGSQDVQVTVNESGDVEDAKVLKGNALFTQSSVNAAKQWKFTPLVQDGKPQRFTAVLVFNYQK